MQIAVRSILGLGGVPTHRTSATRWLTKAGVKVVTLEGDSRRPEAVALSDLPPEVRRAVIERDIAASGLPLGSYDEAAHQDLAQATPKMRNAAERKAAIARDLVALGARVIWTERAAILRGRHGEDGISMPSLMRILKAVEGLDPINFAPALLADYSRDGAPKAPVSDAAWSLFLTIIRDAGEGFKIKSAWRDVRDLAVSYGWQWPDLVTVWRRWNALPEAQKLHARIGHAEAVKRLGMPAMRDKTTIGPMEWVSLDGRTKDFWAHNGDGKPRRYTFLALVDCASNFILGWTLAESENARATQALIKRVCQTWGIFDRLYPDNGSAFAGHLVAGGAVKRFRNSGAKMAGVKPLGICHHLGIAIHFALPGNGQAKTAERTFASLSRVLDDRAEFKGAHAGHKAGAAPDSSIVPVSIETAQAVCEREVARHNAEPGRRGQGMKGRSYQAVFEDGLAKRVKRTPTARQLYLSGLIYTPVKVNRCPANASAIARSGCIGTGTARPRHGGPWPLCLCRERPSEVDRKEGDAAMTRKIPEGYVAIPFIAGQSDKVEQSVDPAMPKDIVTLRLNLRFAQRLQQATGDVPYLLGNAASVFQMLWKLTSAGFTPEENELCGLYELCSRGLSAAAEKEGEEINRLAVTLRSVLALHTDKEV